MEQEQKKSKGKKQESATVAGKEIKEEEKPGIQPGLAVNVTENQQEATESEDDRQNIFLTSVPEEAMDSHVDFSPDVEELVGQDRVHDLDQDAPKLSDRDKKKLEKERLKEKKKAQKLEKQRLKDEEKAQKKLLKDQENERKRLQKEQEKQAKLEEKLKKKGAVADKDPKVSDVQDGVLSLEDIESRRFEEQARMRAVEEEMSHYNIKGDKQTSK